MTDRELLELAAKAAGMKLDKWKWYNTLTPKFVLMVNDEPTSNWWNPLTDDGDALRLAVKLKMGISIPVHRTIKADVITFLNCNVSAREEGDDPYAATRRAIVRAAAEIGKELE